MRYSLMTFGIACHDVPQVDQDEERVQKLMDKYLENMAELETREAAVRAEEDSSSDIIPYPEHTDALIGRGCPYYEFSGTRRLLVLIDSEKDRYSQLKDDKFQKTCFSIGVVKKVQESNGRFLQRTERGWKVMDDGDARKKVINLLSYSKNTGLSSIVESSSVSKSRAKRPKLR
jgi:hypothetical protein